ncbi:MAG TPA: HAD-IB family hydrolase [Ilumatobacteraceae bacterium]|nr:HAD-IB family hydrolase [Ilumatobacteraceae bacterium]
MNAKLVGNKMVIAAFDVDGTLTTRDCVRPFLERAAGRRRLVTSLLRRPLATVVAAVRRDRDRFKEIIVGGSLRGKLISEVETIGEQFAQFVLVNWLRPDTVRRLRWHQQAGHRTVLVSASLAAYLRPLALRLGIDDVLCTDSTRSGERYGDRLVGLNCRADEKRRRLEQWMEERRWIDAEVWAYGDSIGDRELLARADHPVWVDGETISEIPDMVAG